MKINPERPQNNLFHVGPFRDAIFQSPYSDVFGDSDLSRFDSHLLLDRGTFAGQVGDSILETVVQSDDAGTVSLLREKINANYDWPISAYVGNIEQGNGAFFFAPDSLLSNLSFARLVGIPGTSSRISLRVSGQQQSSFFDVSLDWNERNPPPLIEWVAVPEFVEKGSSVRITAQVHDDDGVAMVEFFDNGHLIPGCRLDEAPFECDWAPTMNPKEIQHSLSVIATDKNGDSFLSRRNVSVSTSEPFIDFVGYGRYHRRTYDIYDSRSYDGFGPIVDRRDVRSVNVGNPVDMAAKVASHVGVESVEFFANGKRIEACGTTTRSSPTHELRNFPCRWVPNEPGNVDVKVTARSNDGSMSTVNLAYFAMETPIDLTLKIPNLPSNPGDEFALLAQIHGSEPIQQIEFFEGETLLCATQIESGDTAGCMWSPPAKSDFYPYLQAVATTLTGIKVHSNTVHVKGIIPGRVLFDSPPYDGRSSEVAVDGEAVRLRANRSASGTEFLANNQPIECSTTNFGDQGFTCIWTPPVGHYDITVAGRDYVSDPLELLVVAEDHSPGIGARLPRDSNGLPVLETSRRFDPLEGSSSNGLSLPAHAAVFDFEIPVEFGGRVRVVDVEKLEDTSDAFLVDQYDLRLHPYHVQPDSGIPLQVYFRSSLPAGNYSSTFEFTFDDGTQVRSVLNATLSQQSLAPEPKHSVALLFVLFLVLTRHAGQRDGTFVQYEYEASRTANA